jgi:hypothetical protein
MKNQLEILEQNIQEHIDTFISLNIQPQVNAFCDKWKFGICVGMGTWSWAYVPCIGNQEKMKIDPEYDHLEYFVEEYRDLLTSDKPLELHELEDLQDMKDKLSFWKLSIDQLEKMDIEFKELREILQTPIGDNKFQIGDYVNSYQWERFLPCGTEK